MKPNLKHEGRHRFVIISQFMLLSAIIALFWRIYYTLGILYYVQDVRKYSRLNKHCNSQERLLVCLIWHRFVIISQFMLLFAIIALFWRIYYTLGILYYVQDLRKYSRFVKQCNNQKCLLVCLIWHRFVFISHFMLLSAELYSSYFDTCARDIHIECSRQFKWNLYFYVSGQSRLFWAALKLL